MLSPILNLVYVFFDQTLPNLKSNFVNFISYFIVLKKVCKKRL